MKKIIFTFIGILSLLVVSAQQLTADEIIKKAEDKIRGNSSYAEFTIQIIRPKWTREMQAKVWSLGTKYSLILITAPAKEKGTVFLKRDKEIWNWVPSISRTIKLPPSMMSQSWMGSDFTNDDLVKESSMEKDYTHKLVGDSVVDGRDCYKIELTPKPDAAVVWGKIITFIDKKDFLQLRTEFYDEDGYLVNIMTGKDIKMLGGKLLPSKMEMIPVDKPGNKTVLIYQKLEFDIQISEDFFSVNNMKRVK
ncbi:MAG: outer membrane lipoprotein-sorting protein [Bacteroidetes bacterium]|nr:MAG: outer membrane lipoprotein-sorting protein [Bacteroidota bacterium]